MRRSITYSKRQFPGLHSPILRYGFSLVSVAVALGVAVALQHYRLDDAQLPVFTFAIAITAWYAGIGPSGAAVLLSSACFDYFFTEPLYSLDMTGRDLFHFFNFTIWATIVASFFTVRRRTEANLRQARETLQVEVEQRRRREDEIRKLNEELSKRAAELDATNKELESFTYTVSHDLRAPLRHMVGYSELLQRQASSLLDEKSQRFLRTILDSARRMGNLIDDQSWRRYLRQFGGLAKVDRIGGYAAKFSRSISIP